MTSVFFLKKNWLYRILKQDLLTPVIFLKKLPIYVKNKTLLGKTATLIYTTNVNKVYSRFSRL